MSPLRSASDYEAALAARFPPSPLRAWALALVGVVVIGGAMLYCNRKDTKAAGADDAHIAALDSAVARLGRLQRVVDTQYLATKTIYSHETRIAEASHAASDADTLNAAKARAALADETTARKACELTIVAGERVASVCKERADSLQAKIALLEHPHRPRLVPYLDAGWSFTDRAPALVGGADYRLFGDRLTLRASAGQSFTSHQPVRVFAGAHLSF